MARDKLLETAEVVKNKHENLVKKTLEPEFGTDIKEMTKIMREIKKTKALTDYYNEYLNCEQAVNDLKELIGMGADEEMIELAKMEASEAEAKMPSLYEKIKIELLPKDPNDDKNVIVEIRGAAGGDEANIFAGDLYKMYSLYAETQGWKMDLIDIMKANSGGFTLISFIMKGEDVYSKLKFENGIHRVQRVPKTESQGRIHTSTASVVVMPEIEFEEVQINKADLRIDVYRSSGAGGQSVNTTDSAVRVTHIPTGISSASQEGRSQHDNKDRAMKQLAAKLWEVQEEERLAKLGDARKASGSGARSEKIRTYNYPQNRVTDHRIGLTLNKLQQIMTGKLEEIITSLQANEQQEKMKEIN